MTTQKAIVTEGLKKASLITDRPLPRLRDDSILVATKAVALNPTDWKHIEFQGTPGLLVGCDYAGVVEAVGSKVTKPFKKGDRIAGFVHGANAADPKSGAFAEHIVVKGNVQMRIPDNLSFEEAATLGVGITTVGQGLYQALKLPLPDPTTTTTTATSASAPAHAAKPTPILIYGGSTASGVLGIQLAKLAGYAPITTCSPHNFALVKQLGAVAAFDYRAAGAAQAVAAFAEHRLELVWDTVSTEASARFCADAIAPSGGTYAALLPVKCPRDDVASLLTMGYTAFGDAFAFLGKHAFAASADDFEFAKRWWGVAETLLREGKLRPHKVTVGTEGLKGVLAGLELLKQDKVSGEKLVYCVDETP